MSLALSSARLAVDIGGTFTDFALEVEGRRFSRKVLTTPQAPEEAVIAGTALVLADAGLTHADLSLVIHGTTLATNAIIERKGARTALLVTQGFRDSIEMAYENRFEQYDIFMDRPEPLVPRQLRLPVPERVDARGNVVDLLDEEAVRALVPTLRAEGVRAVAVGFLHSYANPAHEERVGAMLAELAPEMAVTLSAAVSPELREYERWSTACANAYVQPVMDRYLDRLERRFRSDGVTAPIFLITSAGGLTTVELARRYPIRLVESGPAGGAILATRLAAQYGLDRIVSFDMGGTTAKICLVDDAQPLFSRSFEVARQYRFLKGSGIPIRIPVIEMVEIGAGGGSIATVDALGRIQMGPESAGSEPGPACYGRGGTRATVTDADLVIGRIRADRFAGGKMALDAVASREAVANSVGTRLGLDGVPAALGMVEVVEENMANAARVHAVESGKELAGRAMVAFGGAAPLHAARLAEKLDIGTVVVPTGAGVGSAVGFLLAPVAYEVARTRHSVADAGFDVAGLNAMREEMRREAEAVIRPAAPEAPLTENWTADMRYRGQGHELSVAVERAPFTAADAERLRALFVAQYVAQFGREIPGLPVEITGWQVRLSTPEVPMPPLPAALPDTQAAPAETVELADPATGRAAPVALFLRDGLPAGAVVPGPALIVEDETTTYVTAAFEARINGLGHIVMTRRAA
ncbi:hydantoinase/oxoprolinase family protein [Roseomonas sp. BN140053]|uniref:hydantoinase/oxoprolinase family protein n=1 Tax=Roseomonas sp. BN140053 TaxID=3391898 RepID=UPI0039E89A9E